MTDEDPLERPRIRENGDIEDAVVVGDPIDTTTPLVAAPVAAAPIVVAEPVHADATEPVAATSNPAAVAMTTAAATAASATPGQQVVYMHAPLAPKKLGNRGLGSALAIASGLIYAAVFALVYAIVGFVQTGTLGFGFVAQTAFWIPVLFYVIGTVLLVLIVNRAGWAAYVVGSIFVGLLVYLGTIGVIALGNGIVLLTPGQAGDLINSGLRAPSVIAAGLVAREVSMWTGALISRRGRRLRVRNAEARETYDRDVAQTRADHERAVQATAR